MDAHKIAEEILKTSVDVKTLDPKIENRLMQVKKIYQQINELQKTIDAQVGDLQKQIKDLEKQAAIFHKQLMPVLQELEDNAIEAEGIFLELKKGRRSPKVGYEYLADRVSSELLMAAEEAISEAAKFAQNPTVTLSFADDGIVKTAGLLQWIKTKWSNLVSFIKNLSRRNKVINVLLKDLKKNIA